MISEYLRILESIVELGDSTAADEAVRKIIAHLRASGRIQMLPQIVRELKKVVARRVAVAPKLEVAHEHETVRAIAAAAEAGIIVEKATINRSLIKGWRAQSNGKLVDRSTKCALIDIYKKVIA